MEQPACSSPSSAPGSAPPNPLAAQRALVTRIVSSPSFIKCERLSTFLTYICDLSLRGKEEEINERKIGQAVFGRSRDYDSSADGIVRTQASRLRQRLYTYFENEGAEEPVRLVIPRGGYVPVFEICEPLVPERNLVPAPEALPELTLPKPELERPKIDPATGLPRWRTLPWALALPWLIALLLVMLLLFSMTSRRNGSTSYLGGPGAFSSPVASGSHPLWSRIFAPDKTTLIVPGDSGLVLYTGLASRQITLAEYLRSDYRLLSDESAGPQRRQQSDFANRRYTSIVDLQIATTLGQLAIKRASKLEVRYSRDVRPNDLKAGNVILVGAAEANPWVNLFERNMNFVFLNDFTTHTFSVLNRSPKSGEPRQWNSALKDPQSRVYGVVAFVPNLTSNGNVLILEGTSMSGTEAAWDFVDDDSQLLPFLEHIRRPDGSIPHFELVVGTNNMGASAVQDQVLAWRTSD